jgi:hypothetical protein
MEAGTTPLLAETLAGENAKPDGAGKSSLDSSSAMVPGVFGPGADGNVLRGEWLDMVWEMVM